MNKHIAEIDQHLHDLRRKLKRKRKDFKKFDSKPEAEKRRLTDQGLNPHEPKDVRNRKQARLISDLEKKLKNKMHPEDFEEVKTLGIFDRNHKDESIEYRTYYFNWIN